MGYPQGKIIGDHLRIIEEEILEENLENDKKAIEEFLTRMGKNLDSLTKKQYIISMSKNTRRKK